MMLSNQDYLIDCCMFCVLRLVNKMLFSTLNFTHIKASNQTWSSSSPSSLPFSITIFLNYIFSHASLQSMTLQMDIFSFSSSFFSSFSKPLTFQATPGSPVTPISSNPSPYITRAFLSGELSTVRRDRSHWTA